jgi:transcriptional regulator with XRE-family HTH domain
MAGHPAGTRIRLRRQALKLTQQQLAEKLGVDRATVSAWERGKQYPDRNEGAIEAVLGISLTAAPEAPPDPQEEALRDLGKDRGGFLDEAEVGRLLDAYRLDAYRQGKRARAG